MEEERASHTLHTGFPSKAENWGDGEGKPGLVAWTSRGWEVTAPQMLPEIVTLYLNEWLLKLLVVSHTIKAANVSDTGNEPVPKYQCIYP